MIVLNRYVDFCAQTIKTMSMKHQILIITNPLALRMLNGLVLFTALLLLQACSEIITRHPAPETAKSSPDVSRHQSPEITKHSLIKIAHTLLGTPYHYGGDSPESGFDCSGFIQYTFEQEGINLPRTSREQYKSAFPISRRELKPGDLVFFRARHEHYVSHVGLYIGKGKFIHAPSRSKQVSINSLDQKYWRKYYFSAGRVF